MTGSDCPSQKGKGSQEGVQRIYGGSELIEKMTRSYAILSFIILNFYYEFFIGFYF
jgi:hypothetical protein